MIERDALQVFACRPFSPVFSPSCFHCLGCSTFLVSFCSFKGCIYPVIPLRSLLSENFLCEIIRAFFRLLNFFLMLQVSVSIWMSNAWITFSSILPVFTFCLFVCLSKTMNLALSTSSWLDKQTDQFNRAWESLHSKGCFNEWNKNWYIPNGLKYD